MPRVSRFSGSDLSSRLLGFGALPFLSALGPLLALPLLARSASVNEWAALTIGQAVGSIGALVVGAGWSITGPALVARAKPADRPDLLLRCCRSRSLVALVATPLLFTVSFTLAPDRLGVLAGTMAACTAMNGLTLVWYAVGSGQPRTLALYESIPRLLGAASAGVLVALTGQLMLFPLIIGAVALTSMSVFLAHELGARRSGRANGPKFIAFGHSLATEVVAGTYSMGAPGLVALGSTPLEVATFGAAHRLSAFGSVAIAALSNSLQGWVAESSSDPRFLHRCRVSLMLHALLGVGGLATLAVAGPLLTSVIFGSHLKSDRLTTAAFGVFFLFWSLEAVTSRHILGALGHTRPLLLATTVGSVTGVVLVLATAAPYGPPGAALSIAGAAGLTFTIELWFVVRALKKPRAAL